MVGNHTKENKNWNAYPDCDITEIYIGFIYTGQFKERVLLPTQSVSFLSKLQQSI